MRSDLTTSHGTISKTDREHLLGQRGCVVWLTGLSGSGKSTIARELEARLYGTNHLVYVLDGDNVRQGLNSDLGFSGSDRTENIRRIAEVSALFVDAGVIVLTAFISPFRRDRSRVRALIGDERFIEVHVDAPLSICEQRDPKGLYGKARAGELAEFTGISSPYEPPEDPALRLDTTVEDVAACVDAIVRELEGRRLLRRSRP